MSDFLSRLAARALGAAPPLQPLVGSRFAAAEPADGFVEETVERDGSAPPLRRSVADAASAAARSPAAEASVRVGDPPSLTSVPGPSPAVSGAPSPVEGRTPTPDRTAPEGRALASSALTFEPDDAAATASEVAPSVRAPESIPTPPVHASSPVRAEHVETSRPPAPVRVETKRQDDELLVPASAPPDPPAFSSTAAAREDGSAPHPAVEGRWAAGDSLEAPEPARHTAETSDPPEHASNALLMPIARRAEARAVEADNARAQADARQARAEKERPVVQVTIGRIEVRAVHPPAAPQPVRGAGWTPPVLSLDEYLKSGGGR